MGLTELVRRHRGTLPIVILLGFVASALEGLGIGLFIPLLTEPDALLQPGPPGPSGEAEEHGPLAVLLHQVTAWIPDSGAQPWPLWGAVLLAIVLTKALVQTTNTLLIARIHGRTAHEMRSALAQSLLSQDYAFYLQQPRERLLDVVSTKTWAVADSVYQIFRMAAALAAALTLVVWLCTLSPLWTAWVATAAAVLRWLQTRHNRRIAVLSHLVAQVQQGLMARALTLVEAATTIRLFDQQATEQQRFDAASVDVHRRIMELESLRALSGPLNELFYALLFIAVALLARPSGLTDTRLIMFLVLLYRLQPHFIAIQLGQAALATLQGSAAEVRWLLNTRPPRGTADDEPSAGTAGLSKSSWPNTIAFDQVEYRYPGPRGQIPQLHDVSFRLLPGTTTALLGPSGSGKSTIVLLLCGLLEPTAGKIWVGDTLLSPTQAARLRQSLAVAGQDAALLPGTIADNIRYGVPDAPLADIIEVARLADIDSFVATLPEGYATRVGAQGLGLSHGQRQRIGLARALLRKPKLLILDEALSAVDGLSEQSLVTLLHDRSRYSSALVISHRAPALACCQQAIVLAAGSVAETGPLHTTDYYRRHLHPGPTSPGESA